MSIHPLPEDLRSRESSFRSGYRVSRAAGTLLMPPTAPTVKNQPDTRQMHVQHEKILDGIETLHRLNDTILETAEQDRLNHEALVYKSVPYRELAIKLERTEKELEELKLKNEEVAKVC